MKKFASLVFATGVAFVALPAAAYEAPTDDPYWKQSTARTTATSAKSTVIVADCATANAGPYHLVDDHNP